MIWSFYIPILFLLIVIIVGTMELDGMGFALSLYVIVLIIFPLFYGAIFNEFDM